MSTPAPTAPAPSPACVVAPRVSIAEQTAALVGQTVTVHRFGSMIGLDARGVLERMSESKGKPTESSWWRVSISRYAAESACILWELSAVDSIKGNVITLRA